MVLRGLVKRSQDSPKMDWLLNLHISGASTSNRILTSSGFRFLRSASASRYQGSSYRQSRLNLVSFYLLCRRFGIEEISLRLGCTHQLRDVRDLSRLAWNQRLGLHRNQSTWEAGSTFTVRADLHAKVYRLNNNNHSFSRESETLNPPPWVASFSTSQSLLFQCVTY